MLKVFPTETVARSFIYSFAKANPDSAVLEDEFVSWDTFKLSCCTVPQLRKAEIADRIVFARNYLKNDASIDKNSFEGFARVLSRNISYYKKALANYHGFSSERYAEIKKATESYEKYLAQNNLYEQSYLVPDFSKAPKDTVIYFASSVNDPEVNQALKYFKTVEYEGSLPNINVYKNSICEIRDAIRNIRKLLEKGVKASEIALTVVNPESCLTYIKEESSKRNVELSFTFGKKLSAYKAGTFFKALKNVVDENYSIESMKKLLLDIAYPFKDRQLILSLIRKAIKYRIKDGKYQASEYLYKFRNPEDVQELAFVTDFAKLSYSVVKAKDVASLRTAIRIFQDRFFEKASWDSTENPTDIKAFERCMEVLDSIEQSSYSEADPYTLLCNIIDQTVYVSADSGNGVKVYKYPLSAGLQIENHFVIGLSEDESRIKRTHVPFEVNDQSALDIGDNVIRNLCYGAQNLVISCAKTTYSSEVCVPSVFVKENKVSEKTSEYEDSFKEEEQNYRDFSKLDGKPIYSQVKNFEKACQTTISLKENPKLELVSPQIKLSATSVNDFKTCPYMWYMKHELKLEESEYEVKMDDPRIIGTIIHDTYETFLREVKDFSKGIEHESRLRELFFEKVENFAKSTEGFDKIWAYHIKNKYSNCLIKLFDSKNSILFNSSKLEATEKHFKIDYESYSVSGSIDCILATQEGSYAVIDFKKGEAPKTPDQLVLYAKALDKKPQTGAFYSVKNSEFKVFWTDTVTLDELAKDFDENIKNIVSNINKCNFTYAEDVKDCGSCIYKRICRKRYVIK